MPRRIVGIARRMAVYTALFLGSAASSAETQTYTYDAKGRLIVKKSSGDANHNETHSYCYDKAGNRVTYESNATGTQAACVTDGTPSPVQTNQG